MPDSETVADRLRERARRVREQAILEHADGDARVLDPQPVDPPPHATDDLPETFRDRDLVLDVL